MLNVMGTRLRRKVRRYALCVFLYACLMYMMVLTAILYQLNEEEFQMDGIPANSYTKNILTTLNTGGFRLDTRQTSFETTLHLTLIPNKRSTETKQLKRFTTSVQQNVTFTTLVNSQINQTLRRTSRSRPIVFLHIGKNGGTSFDNVIKPIISRLHGRYIGQRHFDWSYIETIKDPDVVVLLRQPVSRAVSHFHFARKIRTLKTKSPALSDYFENPQLMLETRDIWQDGQAAVSWLTGTHIANWVGIKKDQVPGREIKSLDHKTMCKKAAERLEQTFWFGFLDDQDRSFEMLQWQLGSSKQIKLPKRNVTPHSNMTINESQILESLMPMDMWLYNYAKILFEERWKQYKTGVYNEPKLPPFPEITCKSTRFILACNKHSPLGPLYYAWNTTRENTLQQMKLLPKKDWLSVD